MQLQLNYGCPCYVLTASFSTNNMVSIGAAIDALNRMSPQFFRMGGRAIEMVTVPHWPMLPNQACGGVGTFAPIRNVLTTIHIVANGTEMCSL